VVRITGANFVGITAVKFNGVNAAFAVTSSKLIHATVPDGATTGPVSVQNGIQTAATKSAFTALYDAPFASCLASGNANVPAGTEPYIGIGTALAAQSYVKPFLRSTTTTLTVDGKTVKNAAKFWDKHGDYAAPEAWTTYWGYHPGIVLPKGATMTFVFHVVATKPFSDGFFAYKLGQELMAGPTCTLHAVEPAT
jgi:IPT/TIG domain-containing protein